MEWFRLYHDIIDDPKVLELSLDFRWRFVEILAISSRQSDRGTLPKINQIAIHMRVTKAKAERIVSKFVELGFIDVNPETGGLSIHGWKQRQFKSDDVTSRWRRHRQRKSNVGANVGANVIPTFSDTETDTDTETDKESPPITPPLADPDSKPVVLPEWLPLPEWEAFCEMRREIGSPLTSKAKKQRLSTLRKLRSKGEDPALVLAQSVARSWENLYEVKPDFHQSRQHAQPTERPKVHVEPPDSPYRAVEARRRQILFGLFGGSPAAAQPGGGTEHHRVVSDGEQPD